MEPHEALVEWAQAKGVVLNGISPERLPGRGIGIVATKAIKAHEVVLEVPTSCLRSIETVPEHIARRLPKDISVHGLLAADLALDPAPSAPHRYGPWNAVLPTPADFASMPLLWPPALQARLPGPAKKLLAQQQANFTRDWTVVSQAFPVTEREQEKQQDGADEDSPSSSSPQRRRLPPLTLEAYRHAWLLVNTRTFYYLSPRLRHRRKADHMVLQPVADLFNHAEAGCHVAFDGASFAVAADRPYARGDEVRICYGRHSGDFLAVEYGFAPPPAANAWDEVGLDAATLLGPRLGRRWRDRLDAAGFLGGYALDRDGVCHRTQVAVRALCCGVAEWRRFVDGEDDGAATQARVDELLVELLEGYAGRAAGIVAEVEGMAGEGTDAQRALLVARWQHIRELVDGAVARLKGGGVEKRAE